MEHRSDSQPAEMQLRLRTAAMALFHERGYRDTTVDAISRTAGVSRRTFFRYYSSKDDVLFPNHPQLLAEVEQKLQSSDHEPIQSVIDAIRIVFDSYLAEPCISVQCFKLVRGVTELRDREIAWVSRYSRALGTHLRSVLPDDSSRDLQADVIASAILAAHNHVLRRWLVNGGHGDPHRELAHAMSYVAGRLGIGPTSRITGSVRSPFEGRRAWPNQVLPSTELGR